MGYSDKYMQHFSDPQNVGEIQNPDSIAEVEHKGGGCFDRIRMTIKTNDKVITELKFKARACSGTIAATSAATQWSIGKTLQEASEINADKIADYLDGVPDKKRHSVELAAEAVQKVIENLKDS